ncbi:MAG TPA: hypothetical protein VIJ20_07625 [Solirubrobacteraceae bacterium]
MEPRPIRIRLEIEPAGESLLGRATDDAGTTREFMGWLGLAAAIDALLRAPSKAADGSDRAPPAGPG